MARVLIVEPEPDLRQLAEEALVELGHDAVLCEDGHPAPPFDVLLLASFAGMRVVVEKMTDGSAAPPLVCVGTSTPSAEARALHPAVYLVKPYTLAQLEHALGRALGMGAPR